MGLFGEEDEETAEEVDPPELEDEPGLEPSASTDGEDGSAPEDAGEASDAEGPDASQDEQPSDGAGGSAGSDGSGGSGGADGAGGDIDVEEALKDLSARMSVISSNLEGVQESRGELETKIGDVEERMSRLGSLAEAVSSEYNPFVSENAPDQPSWTPEQEDRAAGEDPAAGPSPGPDEEAASPEGAEPAAEQPAPGEVPDAEPQPDGAGEPGEIPRTDPRSLEPEQDEAEPQAPDGPDPLPEGRPSRRDPRWEREAPGELEENLILLEWVGMMLDRVGRAGLMDLLDYYQNLGWLDRDTKDQATRVAVGVDAPDRVGDGHWRGDVELHRRSLVAIQRLQGDEIPAARLDELELDLRRLFRE